MADIAVRTVDNFSRHRTGRNAAVVAHYSFLSVFPLMLVFTTVLGFLLESRPTWRKQIINSAFNRVPIIGQQIGTDPAQIQGSVFALVVGLTLTLWAGLRAFNALQTALDDVAEVPRDQRPNLLRTRVRSLGGIAVVGSAQIAAAVLTGFVGVTGVRLLHKFLFAAAAVAINTAALAAGYRWLCTQRSTWKQVAPGAVAAGVIFAGLQLTGTAIVGRAISNATPVYGTFSSVIGLVTWMSLHSAVALLGAEMNRSLPLRRED